MYEHSIIKVNNIGNAIRRRETLAFGGKNMESNIRQRTFTHDVAQNVDAML